MNASGLQRYITEVNITFPSGTPEEQVCSYVFQRLEELGDGFNHLTLGTVATTLGWARDQKKKQAIVTALDFLACKQIAILERRFELWALESSNETLEEPICELSNNDIRNALEENFLINPISGEPIPDFLDHVTVVYVVTEVAKKMIR